MDSPLHRGGRPRKTVDTQQAARLRQQGLSFRKIAKTLRLGEGTVRRALSAIDSGEIGPGQKHFQGALIPPEDFSRALQEAE
jgi:DNA invertase Pin-like site-specific DNA recombinase